jgi:hypothetical protein
VRKYYDSGSIQIDKFSYFLIYHCYGFGMDVAVKSNVRRGHSLSVVVEIFASGI